MKLIIKTQEITFEFDECKLSYGNYFASENKILLEFLKECIQKVADETIKINNPPPTESLMGKLKIKTN